MISGESFHEQSHALIIVFDTTSDSEHSFLSVKFLSRLTPYLLCRDYLSVGELLDVSELLVVVVEFARNNQFELHWLLGTVLVIGVTSLSSRGLGDLFLIGGFSLLFS